MTDLQLSFIIGPSTMNREWNIKIAMLPSEATYLGNISTFKHQFVYFNN